MEKKILYFGKPAYIACDEKCHKAWGVNRRPKIQFNEDYDDDYAFLSDNELGKAPKNPGTYENGEAKPINAEERGNRWCARECERCVMERDKKDIVLPDFSKRFYNIPSLHTDKP